MEFSTKLDLFKRCCGLRDKYQYGRNSSPSGSYSPSCVLSYRSHLHTQHWISNERRTIVTGGLWFLTHRYSIDNLHLQPCFLINVIQLHLFINCYSVKCKINSKNSKQRSRYTWYLLMYWLIIVLRSISLMNFRQYYA